MRAGGEPVSIARTQCSNSVPSSVETARLRRRPRARRARAAAPRGTARARRARRCRRSCARTRATTYGSQSRSSEQRERRPRPLGSCHQCWTSPSTNCRPAARSRCVAREVGPREQQAPSRPAADRGSRRRRRAGSSRSRAQSRQLMSWYSSHRFISDVERIVRRPDLDGAERSGPTTPAPSSSARLRPPPRCRGARSAAGHASRSVPCPSRNSELPAFARRGARRHLQRRAGIQARAEAPGERRRDAARRAARVAVAADERARGRRSPSAASRWRARTPRAGRSSWL